MKKEKKLEIHENKKVENKGVVSPPDGISQVQKNKKNRTEELLEQVNQKLDLLLSIVGGSK